MTVTDSIADALTKIRNASRAKKEKVDIKCSKILKRIVEIMKEEGFINDYRFIEDNRQGIIRVYLKYQGKNSVLKDIKRISKPGRRVYVGKDQIPKVLGGIGVAILSTSRGVITDKQARRDKIGGEVICYIY